MMDVLLHTFMMDDELLDKLLELLQQQLLKRRRLMWKIDLNMASRPRSWIVVVESTRGRAKRCVSTTLGMVIKFCSTYQQ